MGTWQRSRQRPIIVDFRAVSRSVFRSLSDGDDISMAVSGKGEDGHERYV